MRHERVSELKAELSKRVLTIDGAMGTALQERSLTAKDYGGELYEGCHEFLAMTRPETVEDIHKQHLDAGADIIETNTFGSTPLVLEEFSLGSKAYDISRTNAEIARRTADRYSSRRFVAGAIGPTTKAISVTGGVGFEELIENYSIQVEGLMDGGVDYLLIETAQDTRNVKAALLAIQQNFKKKGEEIPVAVSGTIETMGTMLAGQNIEAFAASISHWNLLYIGLNCATGPSFMTDHLRSLSAITSFSTACVPNAGLPDEDGNYLESPQMMAEVIQSFGEKGWLNIIGGCCGTTPSHTEAFSKIAQKIPPRKAPSPRRSLLSGIELVEVSDDNRPVLVGERTNVIGSRKFKRLIQEEKWEEASEVGRAQIKKGAHILDVCLADPDRDELSDMTHFLEEVIKKITAPLMIDSTDAQVVEKALQYTQGKAIINSINLEDGEERFEKICPIARRYGAALIVGCIDDDPQHGMAITLERKLEVAKRSYQLLTEKYDIQPEDIYWDALVFPCGTGDTHYSGSAIPTIEAQTKLKEEFPGTKTVLGVSNISFGLPPAGREVLNSVFLHHCIKKGLDLAIVNTEKLERYAQIPEEEIRLSEDLLWNRGQDPIQAFSAYFRDKSPQKHVKAPSRKSPEERVAQYIIEGTKEGLYADLDLLLERMSPLKIINGPLMNGMDEVGRLFGENQLIVAEVLQSAEAMKAAVSYLEPKMEKTDKSQKGKVLLATVKGDVHDIGKNLVDIILANNGFEIVNLGIKVPPQDLIAAAREHQVDIIGLSGLLVKSAQQMVVTAQDLRDAGCRVPLLVGGAALTQKFTDKKIAVAYGDNFVEYAKDAMHGLELAKQVIQPEELVQLKQRARDRRDQLKDAPVRKINPEPKEKQVSPIPPQETPPGPPDTNRHLVTPPLEQVWQFINPLMLLGRHLGIKGRYVRELNHSKLDPELKNDREFQKAQDLANELRKLQTECREHIRARAVYQFFPAHSEQNKLVIHSPKTRIEWKFQRQRGGKGLCLSDFVSPQSSSGSPQDHVCLFVTTAQGPIRELAEDHYKAKGEFLKSHMLMALALETAEGLAEYLHMLIRQEWGFPDGPEMSMMDRFQARYRGRRYSFGYPACPELQYQQQLFELLEPSDIGVELTEGFMMYPEWSVSALVLSHPDSVYFAVDKPDD